ncbi:MAG: hypothetical protein Q8909_18555 [Bacteroidota bacterium]|nr:hypothetical protein [Bacteroidota bacterium]
MKQIIKKIGLLLGLLSGFAAWIGIDAGYVLAGNGVNDYNHANIDFMKWVASITLYGGVLPEVTVTAQGSVFITSSDLTLNITSMDPSILTNTTTLQTYINTLNQSTPTPTTPPSDTEVYYLWLYLNTLQTESTNNLTLNIGSAPATISIFDKPPVFKTDCLPSAKSNATMVLNAMEATNDIKDGIEALKRFSTSVKDEYSMAICNMGGNHYVYNSPTKGKLQKGDGDKSMTEYDQNIEIQIHDHPYLGNEYNYSLSARDINTAINMFKFAAANGGHFKALVASVYDDSQYMVYIDDPAKLTAFLNTANGNFMDSEGQFSLFTRLGVQFGKIKSILEKEGYSKIDAQSYAIAAVMDLYNTGLKIYKRISSSDTFSELGAEFSFDCDYIDSYQYIPTLCIDFNF